MQTLKGSEDKLMILDVRILHMWVISDPASPGRAEAIERGKRGLLRLMERHQQPQRECKSSLLSMNNTKLSSYYML